MVSRPVPGPRPGDAVYAAVWTPDVQRAERFYGAVLGWRTVAGSGPRGRRVANLPSRIGLWGGEARPTLFTCWTVLDVDRAVELVRAAGGTADDPREEAHGRVADCVDDQGLPFAVWSGPGGGGGAPAPGPGEVAYVELRVPDATRARAFYGTVLGWGFAPGRQPGHWNGLTGAARTNPRTGLSGGHPAPVAVPTFAVADLDAAVAEVRAAGGTAAEPVRGPYGALADAVDDQGGRFRLLQFESGSVG